MPMVMDMTLRLVLITAIPMVVTIIGILSEHRHQNRPDRRTRQYGNHNVAISC